jgi:DNA-binding MarR family transcriptional regulator
VSTTIELGGDLVTYAARLVRAVRQRQQLPAGARVLALLDQHGPLGIGALATADRCSQPTMSGTVADLVTRGLVDKTTAPHDARASVVALTTAGRRTLADIRRRNGELVVAALEAHTHHDQEDLATAVAVLRDVLDTFDEREPEK